MCIRDRSWSLCFRCRLILGNQRISRNCRLFLLHPIIQKLEYYCPFLSHRHRRYRTLACFWLCRHLCWNRSIAMFSQPYLCCGTLRNRALHHHATTNPYCEITRFIQCLSRMRSHCHFHRTFWCALSNFANLCFQPNGRLCIHWFIYHPAWCKSLFTP